MRERQRGNTPPAWLLLLIVGVAFRLFRYSQNWPIWWNEAFVAVNLFDRGYLGLLRPLDYRQVCPIGFLWIEKAVVQLIGPSEWSLRFLPLLASLAALAFMAKATRMLAPARAGLIALALLAIAYHPIQLGAELKPYSFDLLSATIILTLAMLWSADRARPAPMIALAVLSPLLMFSSYPSALVLSGTAAALALPVWKTRDLRTRAAWVFWLLTILLSALFVVKLSASGQSRVAANDPLNEYLRDGFPASWHPLDVGRWIASVAAGRLLAFPFGDAGLPSVLGLVLMLFGLVILARRQRTTFVLILGPILASFAAALLRLYPLGGHPRISQHLPPVMAVAMGFGLDATLTAIRPLVNPRRLRLIAVVAILMIGGVPLLRDFAHPYRTERDQAAREFARDFWPTASRDARVLCLRHDLGLLPTDSSNPDVALYLVNRVLYTPRASAQATDRLRIVLYYAPGIDQPNPDQLLDSVSPAMTLIDSTRIDLPHHGDRGGRVDVFECVVGTLYPGTPLAQALQSSLIR